MAAPQNKATLGPPALTTVADVANFLAISRSKIYKLMDEGELPYVKLGKCRRVLRTDVEALLEKSRVNQSR